MTRGPADIRIGNMRVSRKKAGDWVSRGAIIELRHGGTSFLGQGGNICHTPEVGAWGTSQLTSGFESGR
jgi:hypothetical protein